MTCCGDKIRVYGFTYKYNMKGAELVTEEDYQTILNRLNSKGTVIDVQYEKDKKGRLHIHGVVEFKKSTPLFKSMCPFGFHSHFEEIYDIGGWQKYMYKDTFRNKIF